MARSAPRAAMVAWSYGFAASGAVLTAALIALESAGADLGGESVAVVGAYATAATVAMIVGVVRNRPEAKAPWLLLATANITVAVVFAQWLFEVAIGPVLRRMSGLLPVLLTVGAVFLWLRRESGSNMRRIALDAALVGFGGVSAAWAAFVTPHIERGAGVWAAPLGRLVVLSIVAAALTVLLHLCVARGRSNRAYPMITVGTLAVGVAVALYLAGRAYPGAVAPAHIVYALLPLIVGLYAAAALHPTMADPAPRDWRATDHPPGRFLVIAVVLVCSMVVAAVSPPADDTDRMVRLVLYCVMMAIVLIRSEYAIAASEQKQAEAQFQAAHDDLTGLPNQRRCTRT